MAVRQPRSLVGIGVLGILMLPPIMGTAWGATTMGGAAPRSAIGATARVPARFRSSIQNSPEEIFRRQCVACHGPGGKGDGPAAVAFNPRPADLTDREFIRSRTDDDLRGVIERGKGSMPAFGPILSSDDMDSLVVYIRKLSDGG